jgi:geranylgeranyl pyrophosphate synthase
VASKRDPPKVTPEKAFARLLEPLQPHMEATERILQRVASEAEAPLDGRLRRALRGGKRLLPALVLSVGPVFTPTALPFYLLAAAVEAAVSEVRTHAQAARQALNGLPQTEGTATLRALA